MNHLSKISQTKIKELEKSVDDFAEITNDLLIDLEKMYDAFHSEISFELSKTQIPLSTLRNDFKEWNRDLNTHSLHFEEHIDELSKCISLIITANNTQIHLHAIYQPTDQAHLSVIIHAINTFFTFFPTQQNIVTIYLCLNDHPRLLGCEEHTSYSSRVKCLQKKSLGMNVSGSTEIFGHVVHLTRKEEIVKLLFHELIHCIGLDRALMTEKIDLPWSVESDKLLISEAYTEFLSVYLHSMYLACHFNRISSSISIWEWFTKILPYEITHSIHLCQKTLEFYQYTDKSYQNFFRPPISATPHSQPIALWEYILLRTILLLHLEDVLKLTRKQQFRVTPSKIKSLISLLQKDDILIQKLMSCFQNPMKNNSISYLAFDVDWNSYMSLLYSSKITDNSDS